MQKAPKKRHVPSLLAGSDMHDLATELFPLCRSLTGNGVRETLTILQKHIPLKIYEIPSGTKAFDWKVPKEWNIRDAYVLDSRGKKVIDFKAHTLHVVGYATPIDETMPFEELDTHLYSIKKQPNAIPYITSYYKERWGFCLRHTDRKKLRKGMYRVVIDSELKNGSLTYGELILPGKTKKEIFLSTYICHPSLANDNLSGIVVATALSKWLMSVPRLYTYRIIFIPETIGSLLYLSRNLKMMKKNIIAGFTLTCMGDERAYSYVPSRIGNTLADRVALHVLASRHPNFTSYSYLDRGSDERQYCSPGVDLPVASIMRSKYGEYPEYHTSLDSLSFVTSSGLEGSAAILRECIEVLEGNARYRATCCGEPQLGKRGLYPENNSNITKVADITNILAYADGKNDLVEIAERISLPAKDLLPVIEKLLSAGLLTRLS